MANKSPLRVLSLLYEPDSNSISPHIHYLQPNNILEDMYKIIGCNLVTCTQININGQYFDIWSDDEALLTQNPVPSLYINDDLVIFGNLIFAKSDDDGETIGLDFGEPQIIYNFILSQYPKLLHWLKNLSG